MKLKQYQTDTLDILRRFLEEARVAGPKNAYESVTKTPEQAKRLGRPILAHHIHPNTGYAMTAEDMATVVRERYFEVASGHGGVNQMGDKTHVGVERMWDIICTILTAFLGRIIQWDVAG